MKKFYLTLAALATASASALAVSSLPNALYIVKDGNYQKFNFGVASDLVFSNNGKTLSISGYNRQIDLDQIDYITFEAPMTESLTASQQKERLVKIGEEINSIIDVNRHSELILMCNSLIETLEENWDDEDYYRSNRGNESAKIQKEIKQMMKALRSFSKGDVASVRDLTRASVEIYKLDDFFGIYEIKNNEVEKTADADHVELRWTDEAKGNYSVTVVTSSEISKYETSDGIIEIPEKIEINFLHAATSLAEAIVTTDIMQDKKIGLNLDFESNGYVVKNTVNVLDNAVNETTKVWIDGTLLVDAVADVSGRNLLSYDEIKDDIKEASHYHDEDDNCCGENPERLLAHFIKGSAKADILGKLQINGMVYDPLKVYNGVKDEEDEDDNYDPYQGCIEIDGWYIGGRKVIDVNADKSIVNVNESESNDRESLQAKNQYLNDYSDITFSYDKTDKMEGFLSFDIYDYVWSYNPSDKRPYAIIDGRLISYLEQREDGYYAEAFLYDENEYYPYQYKYIKINDSDVFFPVEVAEHEFEITPKLFFPDMTSFYLEDFFDEVSFTSLINDYDSIIDTYKAIINQND